MIKKISLFIFGIISLGLISFSSAGSITHTGSFIYNGNNLGANNRMIIDLFDTSIIPNYNNNFSIGNSSINCTFSNYSDGNLSLNIGLIYLTNTTSNPSFSSLNFKLSNGYSNSLNNFAILGFSIYSSNAINTSIYFDYVCTISGDYIIENSGGGTCDYSQYENEIQTLSGNLATCQINYSNCNSSLTSCQSILSGYENTLNNCSTNLNSCNSSLSACLQSNCPSSNTGNIQRSSLFINDIQHIGAGIIDITIPEEISWDYTNENDTFALDVEGYNVDSDYISGIIDIQNTKPNQVDLNNLVQVVLPLFVPGLVVILFIYFVFRFIKKIF